MPFVNRYLMTPGITDFALFLREVTIFLRSSFISTSNNVDAVYQLKSLSANPVNEMNIRQCSHDKVFFFLHGISRGHGIMFPRDDHLSKTYFLRDCSRAILSFLFYRKRHCKTDKGQQALKITDKFSLRSLSENPKIESFS